MCGPASRRLRTPTQYLLSDTDVFFTARRRPFVHVASRSSQKPSMVHARRQGLGPPPPRFAHRRLNRHRGWEGQIRTRYASTTSIVLNSAWMAVSSERFCLLGRLARGLLENLVPEAWTLPPRVISDEQKRCHESWQKKRTFPRIMMFVTKRDVENCRKNRKIVVTIRDKP